MAASGADLRNVVLKPGMTYENPEIKLSNVVSNADGSFSVDVDVLESGGSAVAPAATYGLRKGIGPVYCPTLPACH